MVASDESVSLGEISGSRWQIPEKSLGENEGSVCIFPLCAAGPSMCDCLPVHQLGAPVLDGYGEASKQSELGPCQAVAHPRELEAASLTLPGRREASTGAA